MLAFHEAGVCIKGGVQSGRCSVLWCEIAGGRIHAGLLQDSVCVCCCMAI